MDRPLVVLDTETARCFGAPHLVELGAVRVVEGEVVETFERFARPGVPIDAQASAIHGIVEEDVREAAPPGEVLADFLAWAGTDWIAAHNAPFDAAVLGFEAARAGIALPEVPWLDSLPLARRLIPEAPDHKLASLCEHLELEGDAHHRALADAVACWMVLEECALRRGGGGLAALAADGCLYDARRAAPAPPRLRPRLRQLALAAREARIVRVAYGDGLAPPATLSVLPRLLFRRAKKDYMEAECQRSGLLKTYLLERVLRVH